MVTAHGYNKTSEEELVPLFLHDKEHLLLSEKVTPQLGKYRHSIYPQKAIGKMNASYQNVAFASCSHQTNSPHM